MSTHYPSFRTNQRLAFWRHNNPLKRSRWTYALHHYSCKHWDILVFLAHISKLWLQPSWQRWAWVVFCNMGTYFRPSACMNKYYGRSLAGPSIKYASSNSRKLNFLSRLCSIMALCEDEGHRPSGFNWNMPINIHHCQEYNIELNKKKNRVNMVAKDTKKG